MLSAENDKDTLQNSIIRSVSVETIVGNAMDKAPHYANIVRDYRSEAYVKGRMYVRRKNILVRFVPSMFRLKKGVKEYLVESYSDVHFTAPNIYDQKVKAVYGTVDRYTGVEGDVLDYFHVSVYAPFLLESKLLSPLSPTGKKYYSYSIDSVLTDENDHVSYRVIFKPKNKSFQLVEGYMVISDGVWSVRELQFTGRSEYMRFDNLIKMGGVGEDSEYLPQRYDLNTTFNFLGNTIDGSYTADLDYQSIELRAEGEDNDDDDEGFLVLGKKKKYDLTSSYNLQNDTSHHYTDSLTFSKLRPLPLTANEQHIYENYYFHQDTVPVKSKKRTSRQFWGQMGDMLISNYTVNLDAIGSVKCSPLINPFLVSYSGRDGFSYRQDFKYSRLFTHDRLLRLAPRIGYNFKHREFYWRINGDYDYWPRKRASLHLNIGNGNRIYTSEVLDDIKEMPDTIFDFNKIHLDYFKDFYIDLRHRVEITNGLILDVGISGHKRTAGKKSDFTPIDPDAEADMNDDITERYRNKYVSFAPRLILSYTPGQYYYMNGERKINLHSKFPTFSVDWERGIKGFFGSTGTHERIEFDMQHQISLGLMQTLYYRAGMGAFTEQDQMFFVDFENFTRNNLPIGWNDEIGGVFQLLDRRWYNASRKYLRGHVTYEAPFLIMPRLQKYTRFVLNERIYLGVLTMPHLNPYIEMGYGIGTHIFDLGLFVGNTDGKFTDFGFKITFELFNR